MAKTILKILIIAIITTALICVGSFIYKKYFTKGINISFNGLPGPLAGPTRQTRAENLDIKEIIRWTNYYRQQNGVASFSENSLLNSAAGTKTEDMFANQYFEHTSPTGKTASDIVSEVGYNYKFVGENLALGDFQNEKDLVDAWMGSEGHRKNILNPDYKEIGVAAIIDTYQERKTWMSVQEFGTKMPNCLSPSTTLKNQIDEEKTKNEQANQLYKDGVALLNQGNNLGQEKIDQAKQLQAETENLQNLINQYNNQVTNYNQCISK